MSVLSIRNLSVTLRNRPVLRDVSFDIQAGEFVGLLGPNGAGKSSLMRAALGLIPARGSSSLAEMSAAQRARAVAWMPQSREIAWPIPVERLVALGRLPYLPQGLRLPPGDQALVDQSIERMGLDPFRKRAASRLSGGEQARTLIARALAQATPLLMADEPAAGLDPAHQISTMEVFASLAAEGHAALVSLHDLGLAARHCTRLILLAEGGILADGAPSQSANTRSYGAHLWYLCLARAHRARPHLPAAGGAVMGQVSVERPWIVFDLGAEMQVLSWAVNRPGLVPARRILWREVGNSDLPHDLDATEWFAGELARRGSEDAVAFLTSRDVRRYCQATAEVEGISAHAVATVGLSNAERIGSRMDYASRNWGTINVALHLSQGLSHTSLIEAMSIAVQARTAAVMETGITLPTGTATGTGTDCVALAAPIGATSYAGLHTATGEVIGRAVYQAVHIGALEWKSTNRRAVHA